MTPLTDSSRVAEESHERIREGLKEAMSRLASSVSVVTTWVDGRPWGTTVSACCSLSMYPPLVLMCLANRNVATRTILERGCFGLNILGADQRELADRAARVGDPKFIDDLVIHQAEMGSPAIKGALASIHCELYNALVVGDHTVIIGEVGDVKLGRLRSPLVYFDRSFARLATDGVGGG